MSGGRGVHPPAPEPLPLPVVDGHTHLDHRREGDDPFPVAAAIAAARGVGVTRMVQIGCDPESARWTAKAVEEHPELVGGVALHPTEASRTVTSAADPRSGAEALERELDLVAELLRGPRIRVVGETGLDHHWVPPEDVAGRAAQEESFRRHIALARETGAVLQIHDRDAHEDVLRILDEEGAPERTVFHSFSGDAAMARHCAGRGWYLSFSGTLTFRNNPQGRAALAEVPPELVLVETDAPYLAPAPHRGRPNASYLVPLTVRCMAEVLDVPLERMCRQLDVTSEELYGPW